MVNVIIVVFARTIYERAFILPGPAFIRGDIWVEFVQEMRMWYSHRVPKLTYRR
jgi:hypothetical protein